MMPTLAAILGCMNIAAIVLLTVDRWVHRVTGKAPMESRLGEVEQKVKDLQKELKDTFAAANDGLSRKLSEIQRGIGEIQLVQARQDEHFKATDRRVDRLEKEQRAV
jgi:predicted nuclease with TOPRIM domain